METQLKHWRTLYADAKGIRISLLEMTKLLWLMYFVFPIHLFNYLLVRRYQYFLSGFPRNIFLSFPNVRIYINESLPEQSIQQNENTHKMVFEAKHNVNCLLLLSIAAFERRKSCAKENFLFNNIFLRISVASATDLSSIMAMLKISLDFFTFLAFWYYVVFCGIFHFILLFFTFCCELCPLCYLQI